MNYEKTFCVICGLDEPVPFRKSADIVKCRNCGVVYQRTRPTSDSLWKLYQDYARPESHIRIPLTIEEIQNHRCRREVFLNKVMELDSFGSTSTRRGRLLDIGCGWGALLINARDKGFDPHGVELTGVSVQFANQILGIPVQQCQIEDGVFKDSMDVITMVHTLEHLPYPANALRRIHSLLNSGGLFCGVVPNIDSMCSNYLVEQWGWLDPQMHYAHYSPESLRSALIRFGFRVEDLFTTNGDYHRPDIEAVATKVGKTVEQVNEMFHGEEIWFFVKKI